MTCDLSRNLIVLFAVIGAFGVKESLAVDTTLNKQALFAYSAYCPQDHVRNWTCFWCSHPDAEKLTVIATIKNPKDDSLAFVGYTNKYSK